MPGGPAVSGSVRLDTEVAPRQPPSASSRPLSPPAVNQAYSLGAGDQVRISLFRLPDYSGDYEVQVDGSLNLALVGPVMVQGLTVDQATALISSRYSQVLRRPLVTLNILSRRPLVIGVAGEINRPGTYSLGSETYPKLTELFELAGGITQSADLRNVQIRRQQNGQTQLITANLWDLVSAGDLNQDLTLRDGDSIIIPSTVVPLEEGPLLATSSFAADVAQPVNIAVIGEVFRPGPYRLRGGSTRTGDAGLPGGEGGSGQPATVTDAIQVAGGIKPLANIRQVEVRRTTRSGAQETFQVDLWAMLQAGDLRQNAILQEGDAIFIPTATAAIDPVESSQTAAASFSPNTIRINVVGEVPNRGIIEVPPNTPLNQGILAAGGFNTRARETSVGLIRLNPDGTVTQREINIDFAQGISAENNPTLQNNDIIIVGRSGLATFSDNLGSVANPLGNFLNILTAPFRIFNLFN
ncbi:SLBB domain-containing protein [Leptolyngbya sp. CCNP1308]|uniref:polysaccharide biosynthesis/export family protein n=1 Tax=Leptolyngbya sp. CCNP1308 TaxID=3110255 RepID=UPI002B220F6B|nr:SLBB domain-containing protein [Leptolyngbya sp. CCNP1308]MEA5448624.1 SLBB domain-containing protein [Leptolyngbya sp. CCNP1308]